MRAFYENLEDSDRTRDVLVAEVGGEMVGYGRASYTRELEGDGVYGTLCHVDPSWRRRGIGWSIETALEARLQRLNKANLSASFLFVGGIFKAVAALAHRFGGWGWLLLSGGVDIVLGVMIWRELPMSGLTIIGVLVGISLIFRGVSWLMVGFALKRIPSPVA